MRGDVAVRRMIRVASVLDSLVMGEPQIFGQIKSAYSVAHEAETVSVHLNAAFQWAFAVAKRVRSETAIGKNPLCWLIPCHRVLRTSGELGGYHWGLEIKRNMLAYEAPAH